MTTTIAAEIFSPRWGHTDTYTFVLEREAMTISMEAREAKCIWRDNQDPIWEGEALHDILQNDSIYPPAIFQDLVEYLWKSWRGGEINATDAETELQEIITWLNSITKAKPKTEFWGKYF